MIQKLQKVNVEYSEDLNPLSPKRTGFRERLQRGIPAYSGI